MTAIRYEPDGSTLERFLLSTARVNLLQGPRGGGKSTVCCYKLLMNALQQRAGPDNYRHRRAYVVRSTYDELKRTTLKTWTMQFPEKDFGPVKQSRPFEHRVRQPPGGGQPGIDWEVVFLALDDENDRSKLLSAEVSDVWLNEFREMPRGLVDDVAPIFRFPAKKDGGIVNPMLIGDTNAPTENHWFAVMSDQSPVPEGLGEDERQRLVRPDGWKIFIQPPGMLEVRNVDGDVQGYVPNPKAENTRWLPVGYYEDMIKGQSASWIRVNVLNKPGQLVSGKPVWPQFRREVHVARETLRPVEGHPILVGVDFGRTPAAVMGQRVFDRYRILRELCAEGMGARVFARLLKPALAEWFPGAQYSMWGDPAGEALSQADENSPFMMFRAEGLRLLPAPTNDPTIRIGAVDELLRQMVDGSPRIIVSPECRTLIGGMEGAYHYRKLQVSGDRYSEQPEKNMASHPADALQYLVVGAGEGRALVRQTGGDALPAVQAPIGGALGRRGWGGFDQRRGFGRR